MIGVTSESFESDGIRVTLEWTYYENYNHRGLILHSYNVNVSPVVAFTSSERRLVQLMASYNTSYNVSILALSQCEQRIMTTTIELYMVGTFTGTFLSTTNSIYYYCCSTVFSFNKLSKSSKTN